jgi:hypothetical protein
VNVNKTTNVVAAHGTDSAAASAPSPDKVYQDNKGKRKVAKNKPRPGKAERKQAKAGPAKEAEGHITEPSTAVEEISPEEARIQKREKKVSLKERAVAVTKKESDLEPNRIAGGIRLSYTFLALSKRQWFALCMLIVALVPLMLHFEYPCTPFLETLDPNLEDQVVRVMWSIYGAARYVGSVLKEAPFGASVTPSAPVSARDPRIPTHLRRGVVHASLSHYHSDDTGNNSSLWASYAEGRV